MWGAAYFGKAYWGAPYWGPASTSVVPVVDPDPLMTFRFSGDGGKTWSDSRNRSMGKTGKYDTVIAVNAPGTFRDFVVEISGSDDVRIAITGANMDVEVLKS